MRHIDDIAAKVRRAERIDDAEAARLWREAPLWLLGELATAAKQRVSGDKVYYNRNFHIEPTNRCVFNCRFCSYRRPAGDPEAWDYTMDEIEQIARERQGQFRGKCSGECTGCQYRNQPHRRYRSNNRCQSFRRHYTSDKQPYQSSLYL